MKDRQSSITRRQFLQATLAGSALMAMPGALAKAAGSAKPPNFVFIFADDLGYGDLGCYGQKTIKTPRLDQMAAEGVRFTDFYVAAPVCTPSRAALLTGCYPLRVGLPAVLNVNSKIGISSEEITLAQVLKTRGYATACIGKWHLGCQKQFLPTRHGFDYFFGLPYSNDMNTKKSPLPLIRNEEVIEQPAVLETLTERYTEEAIKFIKENKERPFFLYFPHTFPHVPLAASERFRGKSAGGLYGDVVECIDWSVGRVLDTLKELGLEDNTLVIFSSDNGPWAQKRPNAGTAGPLRSSKGSTFEGGMREPFIARWPGKIPAGSICSEMATALDILPTFARLAGAKVPTDRIIDGRDIWPLISCRPGAVTPRESFSYYKGDQLQAVRSGKWKLVLPHKNGTEDVRLSLYDLKADIGERNDLSKEYPGIVKRLQALADQCREDLGDALTGAPGKNRRAPGRVAP